MDNINEHTIAINCKRRKTWLISDQLLPSVWSFRFQSSMVCCWWSVWSRESRHRPFVAGPAILYWDVNEEINTRTRCTMGMDQIFFKKNGNTAAWAVALHQFCGWRLATYWKCPTSLFFSKIVLPPLVTWSAKMSRIFPCFRLTKKILVFVSALWRSSMMTV